MSTKALRTSDMLTTTYLAGDRVVWLGAQGDDPRLRDERATTGQLNARDWCGTVEDVHSDGTVVVRWDDAFVSERPEHLARYRQGYVRLMANDPLAQALGWQ